MGAWPSQATSTVGDLDPLLCVLSCAAVRAGVVPSICVTALPLKTTPPVWRPLLTCSLHGHACRPLFSPPPSQCSIRHPALGAAVLPVGLYRHPSPAGWWGAEGRLSVCAGRKQNEDKGASVQGAQGYAWGHACGPPKCADQPCQQPYAHAVPAPPLPHAIAGADPVDGGASKVAAAGARGLPT